MVSAIQKMLNNCPWVLLAEGREDASRGNFLRLPGTQTHCSRAVCYSKPLHSTAGLIGDSPWLHHVIFSTRHNYTMGFCLPWCQPVSKYMLLPRFASVEHWGCPLLTTQAYKCCIYLEPRKPRVLHFREADGFSWRMVMFPCAVRPERGRKDSAGSPRVRMVSEALSIILIIVQLLLIIKTAFPKSRN